MDNEYALEGQADFTTMLLNQHCNLAVPVTATEGIGCIQEVKQQHLT